MDDLRKLKNEREQLNEANGIKVDVDFQAMVLLNMKHVLPMRPVSFPIFSLVHIAYPSGLAEDLRVREEAPCFFKRVSQW